MNNLESVLVTGASGFTGRYMASVLKDAGFKVIGTSFGGEPLDEVFDESYRLDLTDEQSTKDLIKKVAPSYVVHLAGISFVGHEDLNAFYSTNVIGAEHLFTAIHESEADVKNVLIASSANVYGNPPLASGIPESAELNPVNHYAISKLASEFVARKFMNRIPVTIVRPFNYIGYGQSSSFVIPKIVEAYARGSKQLELGSIDVYRDFTNVRDTVSAYLKLLTEPKCVGDVFNVCTGVAISLSDILGYMNEISGIEIDVVTNPQFVRKHEIKKLYGSNSKIHEFTGWKPELSIISSLDEMYKRYQMEAR